RTNQEILAQNLLPQLIDQWNLGEEPVPADVEAVAAIVDCSRQSTDLIVGLKHGGAQTKLRKLISRGQPSRPCAGNQNPRHFVFPFLLSSYLLEAGDDRAVDRFWRASERELRAGDRDSNRVRTTVSDPFHQPVTEGVPEAVPAGAHPRSREVIAGTVGRERL